MLIKLSSKRYINNIDKESDKSNQIDIFYYNDSDERDQMGQNDEYRLTDDREVLKLGKLSSKRYIDNIEKEYDEINRVDISNDK